MNDTATLNNWITFLGLLAYPAAVMGGCLVG